MMRPLILRLQATAEDLGKILSLPELHRGKHGTACPPLTEVLAAAAEAAVGLLGGRRNPAVGFVISLSRKLEAAAAVDSSYRTSLEASQGWMWFTTNQVLVNGVSLSALGWLSKQQDTPLGKPGVPLPSWPADWPRFFSLTLQACLPLPILFLLMRR